MHRVCTAINVADNQSYLIYFITFDSVTPRNANILPTTSSKTNCKFPHTLCIQMCMYQGDIH